MNTPTDFRASLLDLRRQIDYCLATFDDPAKWRTLEPGSPSDGFCLGNWRIVPRFPQNTPSEPPEALYDAFGAWWRNQPSSQTPYLMEEALRDLAWATWQASRAQLNSPYPQ